MNLPRGTNVAAALQAARDKLKAGHPVEAETMLRRVVQADARNAPALQLLGVIALSRRDFAGAAELLRRSLAIDPGQAQGWNNLGAACQTLGQFDEAVAALRRALELRPGHAGTLNNLGVLHARRSELAEAEACYTRALEANSADAEVHNNLGNVLMRRGRIALALAAYRRALELRPGSPDALANLGIALGRSGQTEQAVAALRRSLELRPDNPDALFNLGNVLAAREELDAALASYRRALELRPGSPEIRDRLLHLQQRVCDWRGVQALAAEQLAAVERQPQAVISPFSIVCLPSSPAQQLAAARNWCANMLQPFERMRGQLALKHAPGPRDKLRIGYLSGDFRSHPVARLAVELFELHDRGAFEITGYSCGPDDASDLRARLSEAFDAFVDLGGLSHEDAARRIHADRIDILVDLSGYTQYSRAEVLAMRPAPVQVHYLGQPGTMGADFVDYLITDRFHTPPGLERHCAEQPVYLPSHQVNDRRRGRDVLAMRADAGLPEDAFVFCCMAQSFKLWPDTFGAWMRILQAVPGSVLWLPEYNRWAAENLRREASGCGVGPQRLRFSPPAPYADYLGRLALADLFLDTLPFNAHATAADALWAGLPVLTCALDTHPARLAGSILTAAGLAELVTRSAAEYEARAIALARDPAGLRALRASFEKTRGRCLLFDTPRFTRALEKAYRVMWERYCAAAPKAPIDVSGV
jgi:predicted O-linked N-acetylglucosamine transferase (SPINDLY family)